MKVISGFYIAYVAFSLGFELFGDLIFSSSASFQCLDGGRSLMPMTVGASAFNFLHDIVMLSFSVMVLIVFYVIPDRFKLIASITGTGLESNLTA